MKKGGKEADLPCLSYKGDVYSADSGLEGRHVLNTSYQTYSIV